MIKYLGSKRLLVPAIVNAITEAAAATSEDAREIDWGVLDPFSGTARVGQALKKAGWRVVAGDHNAYAEVLSRCYVQADAEDVLRDAAMLINELNALARSSGVGGLEPGWFTEMFCERSRYFRPENGVRIEAVRRAIASKGLEPELEAVVLTALMEAADRVDSTVGVQMAYLKSWSARSSKMLELRVPDVSPRSSGGKGMSVLGDAHETVARYSAQAAVTYLDPPYNQHSYLGNYHVWETLVRWDEPRTFGVACKREDCRTRRSGFNAKSRAADELRRLVAAVQSRVLVVSFSDEGFIGREQMLDILTARPGATLKTIEIDHRRYMGARIGIYNHLGQKVGRVGKLTNTEYLYIVTSKGEQERLGDTLEVVIGRDFTAETAQG